MWKLYSLVVILVAFYPYMASSADDCEDTVLSPLRIFVNVVNSFTDGAILAGHKCTVDIHTENGSLTVTFDTEITCDDVPSKNFTLSCNTEW